MSSLKRLHDTLAFRQGWPCLRRRSHSHSEIGEYRAWEVIDITTGTSKEFKLEEIKYFHFNLIVHKIMLLPAHLTSKGIEATRLTGRRVACDSAQHVPWCGMTPSSSTGLLLSQTSGVFGQCEDYKISTKNHRNGPFMTWTCRWTSSSSKCRHWTHHKLSTETRLRI